MIILGIDPGTRRVGWGAIEKTSDHLRFLGCGCLEIPADREFQFLVALYTQITQLVEQLHPQLMVVEKLFFFKNLKTITSVSEARGVVLLAAAQHRLGIREVTPLQAKQAVSAYGRASKKEVQKMVRLILGLKSNPQSDDAADALAIAIAGAYGDKPY